MKLNIGSGYKRYDGFINIDYDDNTNPDYKINLDDINLKFPFEDNSVDEVKAIHILEHIGEGYFQLLKELYRICKDGAIIDISVPNHRHDIFYADPTHKRPILAEGLKLFSKKNNFADIHGHSSKLALWLNVDFELIDHGITIDPFYIEFIQNNKEIDINRKCREVNNFFLEDHYKLLVIKDD